jgi:hypothetical protein
VREKNAEGKSTVKKWTGDGNNSEGTKRTADASRRAAERRQSDDREKTGTDGQRAVGWRDERGSSDERTKADTNSRVGAGTADRKNGSSEGSRPVSHADVNRKFPADASSKGEWRRAEEP